MSVFGELKRRNVVRMAGLYLVGATDFECNQVSRMGIVSELKRKATNMTCGQAASGSTTRTKEKR